MADIATSRVLKRCARAATKLGRLAVPIKRAIGATIMSTPQDSPKRRKQKARRTKQLAEWREKKAVAETKSEKKTAKK
jgi:hypothetical protein